MEKKGQIGTLQGVAVSILIIGVMLGFAFVVFSELKKESGFWETNTVVNEEGHVNATNYTLAGASSGGFKTPIIVRAVNNTAGDGGVILSGNWTLYSTYGILSKSATGGDYDEVLFNYTYVAWNTGGTGLDNTTIAINKIPGLLGLIVLIVVIGIILALAFRFIPGARRTADV